MSPLPNPTPRPWCIMSGRLYGAQDDDNRHPPIAESIIKRVAHDDPRRLQWFADLAHIVEAVNAVEALAAERDALKAENADLRDDQPTVDHWSLGYRAGWQDCEAGKWKHISKAPKDGTHIIVPIGRGLCNVVSWFDGAWRETTNALRLTNEPQHWLPLPKPPVTP